MNKYIRTDKGLYDVTINEEYKLFFVITNGNLIARFNLELYNLGKIIKQSDNLVELCDVFYWDCEDGFSIHNFMNYPIAKDTWDEYVSDCLIDEEKIEANMYGCIKTSKGLIYVAKMNLKGELVLI